MMRFFRVAVQPGGPGSVLPWNVTRLGLYFSGAVIKALPIWRIGWFPGERELYFGVRQTFLSVIILRKDGTGSNACIILPNAVRFRWAGRQAS